MEISPNAQAILLLTAPLMVGRTRPSANPLSAAEYRRLARRLRELERQPADLLEPSADELLRECGFVSESGRLEALLGRGFLLSQAVEHWQTRAIWVVSRADSEYPRRLKKRLGEDAPPILYGGGDAALLDSGGLAVVGSRNVDDTLIEYTEEVGRLTASAQHTLVSGGARGVDQAAMRGALLSGGRAVGILADSLEKAVLGREHRDALRDGRLALVSTFDPVARFHVGLAMQRNKLIYALSDAALVVNSDYGKGGTWAGATEQLDKLKFVPVYVRTDGGMGKGLEALRGRGALPWPNPATPEALQQHLASGSVLGSDAPQPKTPSHEVREDAASLEDEQKTQPASAVPISESKSDSSPAGELFAKVGELFERIDLHRAEALVAKELEVTRKQVDVWLSRFAEEKATELFQCERDALTEPEIAEKLRIPKRLTRRCLRRLVEDGTVEKLSRPVRYRSATSIGPLFDRSK